MLINEIIKGEFQKKSEGMKRKIRVAVLGSHATRDVLCKRRSSMFSEIYEICYSKESVPFADLNEEDLNELVFTKPDYIVFDLLSDVYHGAIHQESNITRLGGTEIQLSEATNNSPITVYDQSTEYSMMFRRGFDLFFQTIRQKLPNAKMILHRIRIVSEFFNNPEHANLSRNIINDANVSFFMLEEIVSKHRVKMIDVFTEEKGDKESKDTKRCRFVPYEKMYYDCFIDQLNFICLIDLL